MLYPLLWLIKNSDVSTAAAQVGWQRKGTMVVQRVKCQPAIREAWVPSLSEEDPLEKEMATQPSTLAWKTPWMEKPAGLQPGAAKSRTRLSDFTFNNSDVSIAPAQVGWQREGMVAEGGCAVVLKHLKYILALSAWYCFCQPYDPSIHPYNYPEHDFPTLS